MNELRMKVEQSLPDTSVLIQHIAASKKHWQDDAIVAVLRRLKERLQPPAA
jgi:hypothetical protein